MQGYTILEGREAPRMAERTTLRLGGPVLAEVCLHEPTAAAALPEIATRLGGTLVSLGAGSNILAGGGLLPLITVRDGTAPEITVLDDDGTRALIRATASAKLPVLLGKTAKLDLAGLEGLTGIPGSVGGAVAMNAGSYGQCIGDALETVTVVTAEGTVRSFSRNEVEMRYRHMAIPAVAGWFMVLAATFRLPRAAHGAVAEKARAHMAQKKATQPVTAASAGCVFKNPSPENSAGKLLDEAGFKGKRLGGMAFSSIHANFMVNEGKGTSEEAVALLGMAKDAVMQKYGVALEAEVKIWV